MMAIDYDGMSLSDQVFARLNLRVSGSTEKPKRKQQGRGENQLERNFDEHLRLMSLEGFINSWERATEPFRLAGGTTYTPDFMADDWDEHVYAIELKGPYERDDGSRIKIKVAARLYPQYRWLWVTRPQGQWKAKEVTAEKGIGRKFINLPWLS